jgi:hypothetical protein
VGQSIIVDPSGYVLHRSGYAEETVPIRVDLERVREERRSGMRGLGQPLKSFRDRTVDFAVYDRARGSNTYLDSLGPVEKPVSEISDQLNKKRSREQTPCRQQK